MSISNYWQQDKVGEAYSMFEGFIGIRFYASSLRALTAWILIDNLKSKSFPFFDFWSALSLKIFVYTAVILSQSNENGKIGVGYYFLFPCNEVPLSGTVEKIVEESKFRTADYTYV